MVNVDQIDKVEAKSRTRIEWREKRLSESSGELYFIVAEFVDGQWRFFERSTWETCWYPPWKGLGRPSVAYRMLRKNLGPITLDWQSI